MDKKQDRLRKSGEFKRVYGEGRSYARPFMVLYVYRHGEEKTRAGFTISKRIGNAVVRNRTKRLLREAFRLNKASLQAGIDLVVVARRGIVGQNYFAVERVLRDLFKTAKILKDQAAPQP